MSEACWICAQEKVGGAKCEKHKAGVSETPETAALMIRINEGRTYDTIGPLQEHAEKLERERDLLRRQVEVMAEFAAEGVCVTCFRCPYGVGRDRPCALGDRAACVEKLTQWSLEQAKNGGGGE